MNKRAALILLEMQSYCDYSFSISHHPEPARIQAAHWLFHPISAEVYADLPSQSFLTLLIASYFCPFPYLPDSKRGEDTKLSGLTHPTQWRTHKAPARDPVLLQPVSVEVGSNLKSCLIIWKAHKYPHTQNTQNTPPGITLVQWKSKVWCYKQDWGFMRAGVQLLFGSFFPRL